MTAMLTLDIQGPVALVTIDRPDAANALSAGARAELRAIVDALARNQAVRAVVLTGAGRKVFAAGSDIQDMVDMTAAQSVALSESIRQLNQALAELPQPVVCAVNGWCLGGGLELALACDIRIASETARFGFPEAKLGIMPGGGGLPRLVRAVGSAVARHMVLTGEFMAAARAYEVGLVTQLAPPDALVADAMALAGRMATLAPLALAQIKGALRVAESADLHSGIHAEAQACAVCFASEDKREGMRAFLEKRPAAFAAR